jgi:formate hydrogenlyase transcriptional activator
MKACCKWRGPPDPETFSPVHLNQVLQKRFRSRKLAKAPTRPSGTWPPVTSRDFRLLMQPCRKDTAIPVDVRVLAATHRNLDKLVNEGKFREDLLYRLNVVPITMPSLRERAGDIPILVEYFIARFGKKLGKKFRTIEKKTMKTMQKYEWPGNVRELQNVIERAVTLSDSDTFSVDEAWLRREPSQVARSGVPLSGALQEHEKDVIEGALAQSHGRVSGPEGAATILGVPDSTLDAKIKRLGIDKYRFKSQGG